LHAAGVTNVKGGSYQISTAWFDERALTPRTVTFCTKSFPNLECELVPGSRAVQKKYTRYEARYADRLTTDDLIGCALVGFVCGVAIGGAYGIFITTYKGHYPWSPHLAQLIGWAFLYGTVIGICSATVGVLGAKAYSYVHGYYTTDPCCRYYAIETRKIRPYPYLLGHRTYNEQQQNPMPVKGVNAIPAQEQ
jgi:hypothetical protein